MKEELIRESGQPANTRQSILTEERKETWKSYLMLTIYVTYKLSYGFNVLYVQPIARSMKKAYDIKDSDLSILLTVGSTSSSLVFLPLTYLVVMKGVKISCLVGLFLLTLGTIVELFIGEEWNLIYVGHFITHAGSPVFGFSGAKFCSIWFSPKNRPLALTLTSIMATVGVLLAFIVPGLFVNYNANLTPENIQDQVRNFHIFLLCVYGGQFLVTLLFFEEAPENYVTYEEEEIAIRKDFQVFRQIFDLVQHPAYILFVIVIGLGVAAVSINQLIIVQIMYPFHYSQQICQIAGAIMVLGGVIGSVGYAKTLIHLPNQLRKLCIIYMLILMAYTLFSYLPRLENNACLFTACFVLGFFGLMQVSIAVESLVKYIILTGPERLVIGTGVTQVMLSMSNGILSYIIKDFIMEGSAEGVAKVNITIMAALTLSFILAMFLRWSFEIRLKTILSEKTQVDADTRQKMAKSLAGDGKINS